MERFFKRKTPFSIEEQNANRKKSNVVGNQSETDIVRQESDICIESNVARDQSEIHDEEDIQVEMDVRGEDIRNKIDVTQLPTDPGLRIPIIEYDVNIRDEI